MNKYNVMNKKNLLLYFVFNTYTLAKNIALLDALQSFSLNTLCLLLKLKWFYTVDSPMFDNFFFLNDIRKVEKSKSCRKKDAGVVRKNCTQTQGAFTFLCFLRSFIKRVFFFQKYDINVAINEWNVPPLLNTYKLTSVNCLTLEKVNKNTKQITTRCKQI